jgi:hypothetical protein
MAAHQHAAVIGSLIDGWLRDVEEQYQALEKCRQTPHVLDDYTVGRAIEVYSVQYDGVSVFEEELRRWTAPGTSRCRQRHQLASGD